MPKYNFTRRLVVPVVIVFFTMVISLWIYSQSWKIENDTLNNSIAFISGIILFASIGFGTCVIYPIIFFRGGSIGERIFASLFTPVAWNIKEMIRVSEFFTFGETLYYGLNSVFVLSLFGAFGQMGICELLCRWRFKAQGETTVKVFTPVPVMSILLGIIALYVIMIWGTGVHWFYIYQKGYKALFY